MTGSLRELGWPEQAAGQALLALAASAGLAPCGARVPSASTRDVASTLRATAEHAGVELTALACPYEELEQALCGAGPYLLRLRSDGKVRYLAVLGARGTRLRVLSPTLDERAVPLALVHGALTEEIERALGPGLERWFARASLGSRRGRRAHAALLSALLDGVTVEGLFVLGPDPGSDPSAQLRRVGVRRSLVRALGCTLGQLAALGYGWTLLGDATLSGRVELGWLLACLLAWLTGLSCQLGASFFGGRLLLDGGALLKQRLLTGALRIDVDRIRSEGPGRLLATVAESQALESAGIAGAVSLALAVLQLLGSAVLLAFGAGGLLHVLLLFAWCGVITLFARSYLTACTRWTELRFTLANGFVENVLGHRTRVAQQPPERWHRGEDELLQRYVLASRTMDRVHALLLTMTGRGWSIIGLSGLLPTLLLAESHAIGLAVALGGVLQAHAAFAALGAGMAQVSAALVAYRQVRPLLAAATRIPTAPPPSLGAPSPGAEASGDAIVSLKRVTFAHRAHGEPILRDCSLSLGVGARVLLEGPSGSGKSTLAALLVGLQTPSSGQVLVHGLDRGTLGATAWRRLVASAPQFHENHLLSASLGFNLLMGRAWPPAREDVQEAIAVCAELGLAPLIARMPRGLDQMVGETGWQLSHGERSRVFLARALLQRADFVVLDESFGALDPETLRTCMDAALARAPTLIVIAHP